MAANVESMFYTNYNDQTGRFVPWHGLGTPVENSPTSKDAIVCAGLDWEVERRPMLDSVTGAVIPNWYANVRSTDNSVLGVVGERYQIVQNQEAFDFTDNLIGNGVTYETAGSLNGGKTIWLLAKMDSTKINGDEIVPYICFTNTHDGSGSIKVCMTPTRVVCNNTLNLALSTASRMWSTRHLGNLSAKMIEAAHTLELANTYMSELAKEADMLANIKITESDFDNIITTVFPLSDDATKRQADNIIKIRSRIISAYGEKDIARFKDTGWGVVNAMADFVSHHSIIRNTENAKERRWGDIMTGSKILDQTKELVLKAA